MQKHLTISDFTALFAFTMFIMTAILGFWSCFPLSRVETLRQAHIYTKKA